MPPDTNGARAELDRLLIKELDRLNGNMEKMDVRIRELEKAMSALMVKVGVWGLIGVLLVYGLPVLIRNLIGGG